MKAYDAAAEIKASIAPGEKIKVVSRANPGRASR